MFDIQEELKQLPEKPGIYIMKDKSGTIIYIGKAVVLKNRVRQYFQSLKNMSPKTQLMVPKINEFEFIVTDTELEALILECNLIKKHKPKFNILLKDDKSYPYIKITMNDEYPRILMTRRVEKDGARYFGPYLNAYLIKETINIIRSIFPVKTCKKILPRDIGKSRPCLNFFIFQCMGPCSGNVKREEYTALMKDVCDFLDGKRDDIVKKLETQMLRASEKLEFEKAASIRNKLRNLKQISERQKVVSASLTDQDVIGLASDKTDTCVEVFFIRGGKLLGREHFVFEGTAENEGEEVLTSFIKQFYLNIPYIPSEIILQKKVIDLELIESWLSNKKGSKVSIKVPQKGEKMHLMEMVSQNALLSLNQFRERLLNEDNHINKGLMGLAEIIGIKNIPKRIEAFDISNTGSSEIVGSMVVFQNGIPDKSEYRRFKIKSIDKQNDYASMQEIIFRRYSKKENVLPDMILLDGGIGHVSSVKMVLDELNCNATVVGMVKDDKHRTRGLVTESREYDITKNLSIFRLVTSIQNEAHRFAIEYNKNLRQKRYTASILDEIEGIGAKRKKSLLKHFGSINKIKESEIGDLLKVEGMNKKTSESIYNFFRKN